MLGYLLIEGIFNDLAFGKAYLLRLQEHLLLSQQAGRVVNRGGCQAVRRARALLGCLLLFYDLRSNKVPLV